MTVLVTGSSGQLGAEVCRQQSMANVQGTLHLLEAAAAHGCQRFVYTSTASILFSAPRAFSPSQTNCWPSTGSTGGST
ncbi:NAD-dependent epimerase/dehydratase family protein [Stigmatella aurantiaca]|nr:NAD-dependent epimerase/dehydratase family protein [Stigmatella aurantiaca]